MNKAYYSENTLALVLIDQSPSQNLEDTMVHVLLHCDRPLSRPVAHKESLRYEF